MYGLYGLKHHIGWRWEEVLTMRDNRTIKKDWATQSMEAGSWVLQQQKSGRRWTLEWRENQDHKIESSGGDLARRCAGITGIADKCSGLYNVDPWVVWSQINTECAGQQCVQWENKNGSVPFHKVIIVIQVDTHHTPVFGKIQKCPNQLCYITK